MFRNIYASFNVKSMESSMFSKQVHSSPAKWSVIIASQQTTRAEKQLRTLMKFNIFSSDTCMQSFSVWIDKCLIRSITKTIPKAKRTRGLISACQSSNKFKHKSWSNFIFRISNKHQLQNLDQTSASRQNLRFKILTKPNFITSTKHQQEITDQTPASEHCLRAIFQSWPHLDIWPFQNT